MGDSPLVPVSKIADIVLGGTPKRSEEAYWGGSIKWASAKDITSVNTRYIYDTEERITEIGLEESNTKLLPKDTIVITARGTVGAMAMLSEDMAFNQSCYGLISKDGIDSDYLFYALKASLSKISSVSYGTVFDTITMKSFDSIEIPVPSIEEQKRIAHILGTLDDKIELNQRMNETLEAIARAIFKSWFVDFDPVRAKMAGEPYPLPDEIMALFPDELVESELGLIPKGWEVFPLPEVIDFLEGPGIRNWQYTNSDEGIKFINIRCIKNHDLVLDTANRVTTEEAYGKYSHFNLQKDDLVISTSGTLGRFAIVREEHLPLILNTSVIRMRPIRPNCTISFLRGYVETYLQRELEIRASGSVQRNFGPTHLKQIKMIIPEKNILEMHNEYMEKNIRKSLQNRRESGFLTKIRDCLIKSLIY